MIHLLSRNDLNLRKTHILQGAQPIEIVKRWHAPAVKKYHNIHCKKYKKKKLKKGLTFCIKC